MRTRMRMRLAGIVAVAALGAAGVIVGSSAASAADATVTGTLQTVAASGLPGGWAGWQVSAMVSGSSTPVAQTQAAADGTFSLPTPTAPADGVAYLLATAPADPQHAGQPTATLAAVLTSGDTAVVNERTTVAMAWSMAQFVSNTGVSGAAPGLQNSAAMSANVADPTTGAESQVLATSPNGSDTSTEKAFNSLTAALASCVTAPFADPGDYPDGTCAEIVTTGMSASKSTPTDTVRALSAIARNPGSNPQNLFALSTQVPLASGPILDAAPAAWTLALSFDGDGQSLAGPGNFAIDSKGDVWVINNYQYNADPSVGVCASDKLFEFSPTGQMTTYTGGGLSGAGYGVQIDPHTGNVWVANYGFAAPVPGCPADQQPPHNSVSLFTSSGQALSPANGFTQGGLNWPQGLVIDSSNTVWIPNCNNGTVTEYAGGDPNKATTRQTLGAQDEPFDIVDNQSSLFVSGANGNTVAMLGYDGSVEKTLTDGKFLRPMGLVADPSGTVWAANSGVITLPCPVRPNGGDADFNAMLAKTFSPTGVPDPGSNFDGSVAAIAPDGSSVTDYTGGGLTVPWGITTDGNGNVWVANFAGKRISAFCGEKSSTCPTGVGTGDPISPATTGYFFDGLTRNTGLAVDQSGNVWVANNWQEVPIQTNPGGHQIVAYLGLAAPVTIPAPSGGPTPPPTAPPAAGPGALAATGSNVVPLVAVGLLVLLAGVGLVIRRPRRRSA